MQPIAIIGMACRFPGADTPKALWQLALEGGQSITEVPADRWSSSEFYAPEPGTPGKISSKFGGFIDGVDKFDAAFFGVSPREAAQMDPQQRLLLEVCWQALENAGLLPTDLAGRDVATYFAMQRNDYSRLMQGVEGFNAYTVGGNQFSMTVSRVGHFFDFRGPSMSLDTGCSSVLSAIHLACTALGNGDAELAIVGGVHLNLAPHDSVAASQSWMLSPSGESRSFDASADGYVRSEGCGVFVLKATEAARRDGDQVLAVVRGTGYSQKGHPGAFTAPYAPELERTLRRALERGGVTPDSIGYIEGHGVGSPVADAIEYEAYARVLVGDSPRATPCFVGSIKPNIGHSESAAGAASLIKAIYIARTGIIPPVVHFTSLNPNVDESLRLLEVPQAPTPFPTTSPRRVALSGFGLGGTNAAMVIEEAPARPATSVLHGTHALPISAHTTTALCAMAQAYASVLRERPGTDLTELCGTAMRRAELTQRAVVLGATVDDMLEGLDALVASHGDATQMASARVLRGEAMSVDPRVCLYLQSLPLEAELAPRLLERCAPLWRASVASRLGAGMLHNPTTIKSAVVAAARSWNDLGLRPAGIVLAPDMDGASGVLMDIPTYAVPPDAPSEPGDIARRFARKCELLVDLPSGRLYESKTGAHIAAAPPGWDAWIRTLAELWVRGCDIVLHRLERQRPRQVALPSYPFERSRFWLDDRGPGTGVPPDFSGGLARPAAPASHDALAATLASGSEAEQQRALVALLSASVAAAVARPVAQVSPDVPLRNLGLSSLDMLQLMEQAHTATGLELDPSRFMDQPSIQEIASRIVFGSGDDLRVVDLSAEGNLDPKIRAVGQPDAPQPARHIFLTGATGFLGAFLLHELLRRTDATIYCLVRGRDSVDGELRLTKNLARYGLGHPEQADRVRAVIGDLDRPHFGVTHEQFDHLGYRIDQIVHAGALVNWAYPYTSLKDVNVHGTEEVIRLAAHLKTKPLHHVSTIGVFAYGHPPFDTYFEHQGLVTPHDSTMLGTGYNQSKWVAEKLVYAAGTRRGIPVSIYRPGFVTGRGSDGMTQTSRNDFIAAFLKGIIRMKQAPDWEVALDLMPVDYLASAIVELARTPAPAGRPKAFHMVNPRPLRYEQVYDLLRARGHEIATVPYAQWRDQILALAHAPGDSELFAFWPYYAALTPEHAQALGQHWGKGLPLDDRNVQEGLARTDLRCPSVEALVPVYSAFFDAHGATPEG